MRRAHVSISILRQCDARLHLRLHLSGPFCRVYEANRHVAWVHASTAACPGHPKAALPCCRYIYSFYFSIVTFATVGYGDIHPYSVGETVVTITYIMINIAMSAYIIASITLLVSKGDMRVSQFRDRISALFSYSDINNLPKVPPR